MSSRQKPRPTGRAAVIRLLVSYDGRAFWGSQRQAGQRTVQGDLERAATAVFGSEIAVYLAGRTDRGVHAAGQVASFADTRPGYSLISITAALNDHLERDIAVLSAGREPLGFHARYSAHWREYRYRFWTGVRQPLAEGFVWTLRNPLDTDAIQHAAASVIGEHDFSSFASGGEGVPWSTRAPAGRGAVRTVFACEVCERPSWWGAAPDAGRLLELRVVADGFLPRMVRGLAGTLAEVGRGKLDHQAMNLLLQARTAEKRQRTRHPTVWYYGRLGMNRTQSIR